MKLIKSETTSNLSFKLKGSPLKASNLFIKSTIARRILSESVSPSSSVLYLHKSGQSKTVPLCIRVHLLPELSFLTKGWQL